MILVDTGPLVALIHEDDEHHEVCKETFAAMSEPLGTVWQVLTQAMYLLSFSLQAQNALWEMIECGAVEILLLRNEDVARMKELMRKYRDLPMDLADAALVRVAERERLRRIFTVDRRDFQIYCPSRIGPSLSYLRGCSLRFLSAFSLNNLPSCCPKSSMAQSVLVFVIPAEAGIQKPLNPWIPGSATLDCDPRLPGMTLELCQRIYGT